MPKAAPQRTLGKQLLLVILAGLTALGAQLSQALSIADITLAQAQQVFADATELRDTPVESPLRAVYGDGKQLGYVALSSDFAPIPAYSGKPISTLIGLSLDQRINAISLVAHEEPILVIGLSDRHLQQFLDQYRGQPVAGRIAIGAHQREGYIGIDGISGATITAMVLNRSVTKAAQQAAATLQGMPLPDTSSATEVDEDWLQLWAQYPVRIALLCAALLVLLIILFFQDSLVRHPKLFRRVRVGYLLFTIFFIGFYALAQLSIINILAFIQVFAHGFSWNTLLIEPITFILWGFVALSTILWGRGVFCGWLCPFGALQELIHSAAEKLGVKAYAFPPLVHERLWAIKYIMLIILVGLSLDSLASAALVAELEPFKTTFALAMQRQWWFVGYAMSLLVISAFNSKFYCKYLCTLGAALSFFTRFRIFDWLHRRKECGNDCQTCAAHCQIGAIKPTGEIIENECHYCLECQVNYWDNHICPPLVDKRKRAEKRARRAEVIARD